MKVKNYRESDEIVFRCHSRATRFLKRLSTKLMLSFFVSPCDDKKWVSLSQRATLHSLSVCRCTADIVSTTYLKTGATCRIALEESEREEDKQLIIVRKSSLDFAKAKWWATSHVLVMMNNGVMISSGWPQQNCQSRIKRCQKIRSLCVLCRNFAGFPNISFHSLLLGNWGKRSEKMSV